MCRSYGHLGFRVAAEVARGWVFVQGIQDRISVGEFIFCGNNVRGDRGLYEVRVGGVWGD